MLNYVLCIPLLTSFEIQKEPSIAEIEVCVISILVHVFKQLRIQNLNTFKNI